MVRIVKETNKTIENLAFIDDIIISNQLTQRRNGVYTINFKCTEEEYKSEYVAIGNQIHYDDNLFDITYVEVDHSIGTTFKATCDHISYRLLNETILNFAYLGTPTEILTQLLTGTDFVVGDVEFTDSITFNFNRESSKIGLIRMLAETIGGILKFDQDGFRVSIIDNVVGDKQARIRKNISSINKIIDNRDGLKTAYKIDLINIFKSDAMVLEGFEDFEVITIYDTIRVIDETQGIDVLQDVVETKKNILKDEKVSVTLANFVDDINDDFNSLETRAIKKNEYIYGLTIDNDKGFEVERVDKKARAIFNADEFTMQVGDGLGSYTDALSFDPIEGQYKFVGDIEASGTITGADFIGGTINIGAGTFTVDDQGNVIANSISIGGGTGISNFSDAGALASLDTITGVYIDDNSITAPKINVTDLSAISANIGTITTGTLTGVTVNADTFNATSIITIDTNDFNDGLYLSGFGSMYVRVYDPGGTLEVGPNVYIPGLLTVAGGLNLGGSTVATESWVQSQNYLVAADLAGYATESYAVNDLSAQGISLQYVSSNNTVEVRSGGVYRGAITLT